MPPRAATRAAFWTFVAALALLLPAGSAPSLAGLSSKPGLFEVRYDKFTRPEREIHLTLVKPEHPRSPALLVLFATGDAGWMGASGDIFEHMAQEGYHLVGFNSREAVKQAIYTGGRIDPAQAGADIDAIIVQALRVLALPETTRTIVTGDSRGASLVVFAGGSKRVQGRLAGAVAVALTREVDYMPTPPAAALSSTIQVDAKGRIQTYPAIARLGPIPIAVIQSKGDKYVPSAEARGLFGPDTPTRRLYEVEAKNHGFSGGRDQLMRDLDEALKWITDLEQGGGTAGLSGTSWRLVQFRGGDDTTLTPDDRTKYTIDLAADGTVTARIDCNRGRGSWKSAGPGQLELGPMALTRAMCPPGSLHDQIVGQWANIRSYVMRDGHLFLSLMADGGIYEYEPAPTQ